MNGPDTNPQIDWGKLKIWQVWDPVPWWILERDKLQQILIAQIDHRIEMMQGELRQMERIRGIVGK